MTPDKELQDLREALKASPDNAYIRRLLINKLRGLSGHEAELEREINTLMKLEPHDLDLKQALIEVYHVQGGMLYRSALEDNILLADEELDQAFRQTNNDGLLIIGATNVPWPLDTAFRRPGRFDRIIFVPPPDAAGRAAILKLKVEGKPQENIDFAKVAKRTKDFSGADLNAVIDIAVEGILEEAIKTGLPRPITTKDLLRGADQHRPSTSEWFTTAKNYAMFANKGGLYDDVLKYLK